MTTSLTNIDIQTPTTLAESLDNIPRLLHHNKPAGKRFTPQVIAALDHVLTIVTVSKPNKRQGNSARSHQPPPKRQQEHASQKQAQPHAIQQLLNLLPERGM